MNMLYVYSIFFLKQRNGEMFDLKKTFDYVNDNLECVCRLKVALFVLVRFCTSKKHLKKYHILMPKVALNKHLNIIFSLVY